jgi:hypothetical protein
MTWVNSISLFQWLIIGAIPFAIVMLYFLKLKRAPLEVPSTFLWKRTVEDFHVNSLWQRLRKNLLMFLQIMLILILISALLRPGCEGTQLEGDRFILVIDNSASMSAIDREPSRLEQAKKRAAEIIESMELNDVAMLISCNDHATIHQSFTSDKTLLTEKLADIKPTSRRSDMSEALNAASALANPGRTADRESQIDVQVAEPKPAELYIFSDGNFRRVNEFSLGYLTPRYVPIGAPEPSNVAIIDFSLSIERLTEQKIAAFARIANFSSTDQSVDLSFFINDKLVDARNAFPIRANDSQSLVFDLTAVLSDTTEPTVINLQLDTKDDLELDNVAYAIFQPPRALNVLLVTAGNEHLETVMTTSKLQQATSVEVQQPAYLESRDYKTATAQGRFDLIVFDRCKPTTPPEASCVYVGAIPGFNDWKETPLQNPVTIIDTAQVHPLMQNVLMNDVLIAEAHSLEGPFGSASLCDATFGSIIAIGPRHEFEDVVIAFSILETDESGATLQNTDWPKHTAFPLFWKNLVDYFGRRTSGSIVSGRQPGDQIAIHLPQTIDRANVKTPLLNTVPVNRRQSQRTIFSATDELGVYSVDDQDQRTVQLFAINLLDRVESNLNVVETIEIGHEQFVGQSNEIIVRTEFWNWIIAIGILVLFLEWIVYNRRVFI